MRCPRRRRKSSSGCAGRPGTAADNRDLEKSLLREGDDEVGTLCRFIDAERATEDRPDGYSVARLRRVMMFLRADYYAWLAGRSAAAARQRAEDELAEEIREIHATSRGAYGAPRVHAALRRKGQAINRKRGERIMRERDIRGVTRRRRPHLTQQDTKAPPAPDLVGRDFTADDPGRKLVGDITYLAAVEGW